MDQQHLYKCQGTFVGHKVRPHAETSGVCVCVCVCVCACVCSLIVASCVCLQGPVWALAMFNDMIFSASADCTIKVHSVSLCQNVAVFKD